MDNSNILSWTPVNWITVLLMVALGFAILGFVARLIQQRRATSQGT